MKCEICNNNEMNDLTHGSGLHRNYYCPNCKGHYWAGIWYTKKEWDKYTG